MQQDDDDSLEQHIHNLIIELCAVLYYNGYRQVPMGAMMRLIGVKEDHASTHDGSFFDLDQDFEKVLKEHEDQEDQEEQEEEQTEDPFDDNYYPKNVTLH
jgi:hypothetical protein